MENCLVKLQTKFREDPTVNEGWASFLPRQLHVVFSRSFIKRLLAHSIYLLKDPNGQIMDKCLVKLQTQFREDPTVNEGWTAFLPRQLHVVFSRSFIKRLPPEASSWLLCEAFSSGFFEKLDPYLSTPFY